MKEPFRVEFDASGVDIGAVLSQQHGKDWKPVAYFSRHLTQRERNLSTTERELMAGIEACEHFKPFLYGQPFVAVTDHQPLRALLTMENPKNKLARWLDRLNNFDVTIEYRGGKTNGNADGLSRLLDDSDLAPSETMDSSLQLHFMHAMETVETEQRRDDRIEWVKQVIKDGRVVTEFPSAMHRIFHRQLSDLRVHNDVLYKVYENRRGRLAFQVVVPQHMIAEVLTLAHDKRPSAHFGYRRMFARLGDKLYWPTMTKDVKDYLMSCEVCQQRKPTSLPTVEPLVLTRTTRPGELVTADVMGPLPVTEQGNKYVLVVCDHFTKWTNTYAMATQTAQETAENVVKFVTQHGLPEALLTDQGRNFESELLANVCELLDIHKIRTTPYHPQCDGITERYNRTLQDMLTAYVNKGRDDWDKHLDIVTFAYNTTLHRTTNATPFYMNHGREARVPLDILLATNPEVELSHCEYSDKLNQRLIEAYEEAKAHADGVLRCAKQDYDRKVRSRVYEVGDHVWLRNDKDKSKFCKRWLGPYCVKMKLASHTYKIRALTTKKTLTVHANRLKRCFFRRTTDNLNNEDPSETFAGTQTQLVGEPDMLHGANMSLDAETLDQQVLDSVSQDAGASVERDDSRADQETSQRQSLSEAPKRKRGRPRGKQKEVQVPVERSAYANARLRVR